MAYAVIPPSMGVNDAAIKRIKDKEIYTFNAIEGTFDIITKFNENRIVTARLLPNGNKRVIHDPITGAYFDEGPGIVTTNDGDVVVSQG